MSGLDAPARLRPAGERDVRRIAELHRDGLPDAFLSALGLRFLRAMYLGLVEDPSSWVFVADAGGEIAGFVAGSLDGAGTVRRGRIQAGLAALPRIAVLATLRRAIQTARYTPPPGLPAAELLAIAVDSRHRRGGVATALARALLNELRSAGASGVKVVAGAPNVAANAFYERLGFTHAGTIEIHSGQPSSVWVMTWPSS